MGKFQNADDNGKIQLIKDEFNELVGLVSNEPAKIRELLEIGEKPKPVVAITTALTGNESVERRAEIEKNNAAAVELAASENAKLEEEHKSKEDAAVKIASAIEKMGKKEGCICGTCFNVEATGGSLAPEFDPLIDVARKNAEKAI